MTIGVSDSTTVAVVATATAVGRAVVTSGVAVLATVAVFAVVGVLAEVAVLTAVIMLAKIAVLAATVVPTVALAGGGVEAAFTDGSAVVWTMVVDGDEHAARNARSVRNTAGRRR